MLSEAFGVTQIRASQIRASEKDVKADDAVLVMPIDGGQGRRPLLAEIDVTARM